MRADELSRRRGWVLGVARFHSTASPTSLTDRSRAVFVDSIRHAAVKIIFVNFNPLDDDCRAASNVVAEFFDDVHALTAPRTRLGSHASSLGHVVSIHPPGVVADPTRGGCRRGRSVRR